MNEPQKPSLMPIKPSSEQKPDAAVHTDQGASLPPEAGGPAGLEPTRFGDWERKGKCVDF